MGLLQELMLRESEIRDLVSVREPSEPLRVICGAHIMRNNFHFLKWQEESVQAWIYGSYLSCDGANLWQCFFTNVLFTGQSEGVEDHSAQTMKEDNVYLFCVLVKNKLFTKY